RERLKRTSISAATRSRTPARGAPSSPSFSSPPPWWAAPSAWSACACSRCTWPTSSTACAASGSRSRPRSASSRWKSRRCSRRAGSSSGRGSSGWWRPPVSRCAWRVSTCRPAPAWPPRIAAASPWPRTARRGSRSGDEDGGADVSDLRSRVLVLAGILALAFTGVVGRLGWLQIVRHGDLAALAERQYSRTVVLQAQRGAIVDRSGAPLATSSPAESLFAQPRAVGDPVRVASRLAPLLGTPEIELHSLLTSSRSFVWIHRRLPPSTAAAVKALREPGPGFPPAPLRVYPNRDAGVRAV